MTLHTGSSLLHVQSANRNKFKHSQNPLVSLKTHSPWGTIGSACDPGLVSPMHPPKQLLELVIAIIIEPQYYKPLEV